MAPMSSFAVHIPDADHKLVSPKVAAAIAEWIKKL